MKRICKPLSVTVTPFCLRWLQRLRRLPGRSPAACCSSCARSCRPAVPAEVPDRLLHETAVALRDSRQTSTLDQGVIVDLTKVLINTLAHDGTQRIGQFFSSVSNSSAMAGAVAIRPASNKDFMGIPCVMSRFGHRPRPVVPLVECTAWASALSSPNTERVLCRAKGVSGQRLTGQVFELGQQVFFRFNFKWPSLPPQLPSRRIQLQNGARRADG